MELTFHPESEVDGSSFKYAVVAARYQGKWVFCKNKKRKWEIPGGHREEGESALDAARRELYEETGAIRFAVTPVTAYRVNNFGMLFYAEIEEFGELPESEIEEFGELPESEIERIDFFDGLLEELSFPEYHPVLFEKVRETYQ